MPLLALQHCTVQLWRPVSGGVQINDMFLSSSSRSLKCSCIVSKCTVNASISCCFPIQDDTRKDLLFTRCLLVHGWRYNPFVFLLPSRSQWKVRRTLAFSIHELAVILGDQLTAADLVPIFNGFLKDLDEVRIGVLKHLYDFLKVRLQM